MKTKRYIANPLTLTLFAAVVCISIAGLAIFWTFSFSRPVENLIVLIFSSALLICLPVSLFIVGLTVGAFDTVTVREEDVIVRRFGKKIKRYLLSQNTQLYVQKSNKGVSQYIEIRFPEYFESEVQITKGFRMREGYVCINYSRARLKHVRKVLQNYKNNINPIPWSQNW